MSNYKRNHPMPKVGDMVEITRRHVSEKVQPRMLTGTTWHVVGIGKTRTGIMLLQVSHPERKKETLSINADRFDWRIVTAADLQERKFQKEVNNDTQKLIREFSEQEQAMIVFTPLIIETLVWHYADLCMQYCADNRISQTVKLSRTVKMLRRKWQDKLDKDLKKPAQEQLKSETTRFVEFCGNDFTILYFTVNREYMRGNPDMPHEQLATYALIGMTLIKFLDYYNYKVALLIKQRLGIKESALRDPVIDALYSSFDAYAGNYSNFRFNETDIHRCMRILEIKLGQIDFHVNNDGKEQQP